MKIKLVENETVQETLEAAKNALQGLMNKRRKSVRDKLVIEYLRTFINNPTSANCLLLTCGRADEMIRKEEMQ